MLLYMKWFSIWKKVWCLIMPPFLENSNTRQWFDICVRTGSSLGSLPMYITQPNTQPVSFLMAGNGLHKFNQGQSWFHRLYMSSLVGLGSIHVKWHMEQHTEYPSRTSQSCAPNTGWQSEDELLWNPLQLRAPGFGQYCKTPPEP
jgi:hypothetical protein